MGNVSPLFTDSRAYDAEVERAARAWLNAAQLEHLLCRGNHAFPKLHARNGRLPRGVTAQPQRAGKVQMRLVCRDCGLPKLFTIHGGDLFGRRTSVVYDYAALPGYRMPKGAATYIDRDAINAEAASRDDEMGAILAALAEQSQAAGYTDADAAAGETG
jgi:hypothetical protein